MFLIAELPEFTEIRLIYQTKQKNNRLLSGFKVKGLNTQRWSETPPSYNTNQEETDLLFLLSVTDFLLFDKSNKESSISEQRREKHWRHLFLNRQQILWFSWLFMFQTVDQKVKVKFRLLELKQWKWLHQLNMTIIVPCAVKSSRLLLFYHVVTVSVKSVFNSSGEPRKLRSVLSAGEDPQKKILHLI